jgi:TPR repeat protein
MYDRGRGVVQNYEQAIHYYTLSAEHGFARAQFNLGLMYQNGRGVNKNQEKAFHYFRLAAEQGNARALAKLGTAP